MEGAKHGTSQQQHPDVSAPAATLELSDRSAGALSLAGDSREAMVSGCSDE